MKNYIVTHTFKSKEAKAKMIEVTGSMSMEDMTKAMTSDNAKCILLFIRESMNQWFPFTPRTASGRYSQTYPIHDRFMT